MTILEAVTQERLKYGTWVADQPGYRYPTPEELGKILNAVAWRFRNEGWGLSAKPNGYNVPMPVTGRRIASDILHHQPTNTLYDVLVSAGERAEPCFNMVGPATDSSRPWVAPVEPEGVEPQPQPDDDTFEKEVIARLDVLGDQIFELGVAIEKLHQAMVAAGSRTYRGEAKILGMKTTFTLTPNA